MAPPLGVAMLGCGTVGTGVARLLTEQADRIAKRAGRPLVLRHVVVRNPAKPRDVALAPGLVTPDISRALADPEVGVVAELVGGATWARDAVLAALDSGKPVVTANKALLAEHGDEVFAAAHTAGQSVAFEAAVAGGIPIIGALNQGLAANQVQSLQGILNGTCNFILSAMTEYGHAYDAALAEAQRRGFAEADPTLDVDGSDSAHKLAVLVRLAFGASVHPKHIARRGIAGLSGHDIQFARELGYTIKLLAEARLTDGRLALRVSPVLVRLGSPLAVVRDAYNAVRVVGDAVGDVFLEGRGAGMMPSASAVVADLIDVAVGRAQATFQAQRLWQPAPITLRPAGEVTCRHYVRLTVDDRPGVLAGVTRLLAAENISIASVVQHEAPEHGGDAVPLVIMTHAAPSGRLLAALARIDAEHSRDAAVTYPVSDPAG